MATVREIYQLLDTLAPFSIQMEFDNAGFLVGRGDQAVDRILVSLDITEPVVSEAAERGAQLIVSITRCSFTRRAASQTAIPPGASCSRLWNAKSPLSAPTPIWTQSRAASTTRWPTGWIWYRSSRSSRAAWTPPGGPTASAG